MTNHEKLEQLRVRRGFTKIGLGRFLGVERTWITGLLDGTETPSLRLAARIERWTAEEPDGAIMASAWIPTEEGAAA